MSSFFAGGEENLGKMLCVKVFSGKIIWYILRGIVPGESENLSYITTFKILQPSKKSSKADHIRRGELMQDTYWKQFMMSGKIDDYLNYKNSGTDGAEEGPRHNRGMKDRTEKQPQGSDQAHSRMNRQ